MKLRNILFSVLAGAAFFCSCESNGDDAVAGLSLDLKDDIVLSAKGGSATVNVTSSREWRIVTEAKWLQFSVDGKDVDTVKIAPSSKPVTVEISALANDGHNRSADVIFNGGTTARQTIVVKQEGELGELEVIGDGDGTIAKPYSASQAHALAAALASGSTTDKAVYVRGIIHKLGSKHNEENINNSGKGQFYISNDGNKSDLDFYCYQIYYLGKTKFTSPDQVKVGDDIVVYGKLTNYSGTFEMANDAYLITINGKGAESKEYTIDEAIKAATGIATVTGRIIAVSNNGFVINDGTQNNMFVPKPETGKTLGDVVTVTGPLSVYGTTVRLGDAGAHESIKVESSNATIPATPEQKLTELQPTELAKYDCGGSATYVTLTGKLTTSESDGVRYYNLEFENGTKPGGSVYTSKDLTSLVGQRVKITGYYAGKTSNWFMVCTTEVKADDSAFFSVSPASLKTDAAGGELTFAVSSNVDWTVAVDKSDFVSVSPASGKGSGEVKVTVAENKTYEARTAKITVSTEADVTAKTLEIALAQTGAVDPNASFVELTNEEIVAALNSELKKIIDDSSRSPGYNNVEFNSASGKWTGLVNISKNSDNTLKNNYIQIRNKNGSTLQSPKFDKEIAKVEFVCHAGINVNSSTKALLERTLYLLPVSADIPAGQVDGKDYSYNSKHYTTNYGSVVTKGPQETESFSIVPTGSITEFKVITVDGANYFDSIKVYFK